MPLMEPLQTQPPASGAAAASRDTTAKIVYVLYLLSLAVGVTSLVGVVMAYVNVGDAPEPLRTHYRFQIRTFWIGLVYAIVGSILLLVAVGGVVLLATAVWLVIRCAKGLKYLDRGQAYPDPSTWLW
jgi:uncharacterized membrane protein